MHPARTLPSAAKDFPMSKAAVPHNTTAQLQSILDYYNHSSKPVLPKLPHIYISTRYQPKMAKSILLINGPNLNLLGTREPQVYGSTTLSDVVTAAKSQGKDLGIEVEDFQSNHEGAIIDRIHEARGKAQFVIINPGGLTHTSVALRDALAGVAIPFLEVHISNVHAREEFRHKSFLSDKAVGVICGLGVFGYTAAINFVAQKLDGKL